MDKQQARETIQRLRFEAKSHREQARRMRLRVAELKRLPYSQSDPIARLKLQCSINERVSLAQSADKLAKEIKETFFPGK